MQNMGSVGININGRINNTLFSSQLTRDPLSKSACYQQVFPGFPMRTEPVQVKQPSVIPLQGDILAIPTNIRLDWKSLPETNTQAYWAH
jgi:hypothetical protein